jgi:hypothetical protein
MANIHKCGNCGNILKSFIDDCKVCLDKENTSERYIAKTDPYICMVSTPNLPLGLYDTMEREEDSIYIRKSMGYELGIGKVFTEELIEKAKQSPSFEREYNLKYGYGIGNIFLGLDDIIEVYDVKPTHTGISTLCADPAFGSSDGSSNFGVCGGEKRDGIAHVLEAREYPRPSPSVMLDILERLAPDYNNNVKVDAEVEDTVLISSLLTKSDN